MVQGWSAAVSHKETGNSCSDSVANTKAEASPSTCHLMFETQDMVLFIPNEDGALSPELLPDKQLGAASIATIAPQAAKAELPNGLQVSQPQW